MYADILEAKLKKSRKKAKAAKKKIRKAKKLIEMALMLLEEEAVEKEEKSFLQNFWDFVKVVLKATFSATPVAIKDFLVQMKDYIKSRFEKDPEKKMKFTQVFTNMKNLVKKKAEESGFKSAYYIGAVISAALFLTLVYFAVKRIKKAGGVKAFINDLRDRIAEEGLKGMLSFTKETITAA